MSSSRLRICARMETSSAETGSSQTMSSGSSTSARAIEIRWHWPPENSCGRRRMTRSGSRPTACNTVRTRDSRSPRSLMPAITSGSAMMSPIRRRGFSEAIGSWKMSCTRRRSRRSRSPLSRTRSTPSKTTLPDVGRKSCSTARASVDLPQPDSPTSPSVSPRFRSKLTSETAWMREAPVPCSTTRCSTLSSIGSARSCARPLPAITPSPARAP